MSVIVAVAVPEGIALAADSRMTTEYVAGSSARPQVRYTDGISKVFPLTDGRQVVAATCGFSKLNGQSISAIARDFRKSYAKSFRERNHLTDPEFFSDVVNLFKQFVADRWVTAPELADLRQGKVGLSFLIAGYRPDDSGGAPLGIVCSLRFLLDSVLTGPSATTASPKVLRDGAIGPISRLLNGCDDSLEAHLMRRVAEEERRNPGRCGPCCEMTQDWMRNHTYRLGQEDVRSAEEFGCFLIRVVHQTQHYGDPDQFKSVGGHICLARLTPHQTVMRYRPMQERHSIESLLLRWGLLLRRDA